MKPTGRTIRVEADGRFIDVPTYINDKGEEVGIVSLQDEMNRIIAALNDPKQKNVATYEKG